MKTYCENTYCETPAVKEVPVSVHRAGDQKRSLCATCFEAYTWGVQHGRMSEKQESFPAVERFLKQGGFVVVGQNHHDPHPGMPWEAWAYQGPLDFNQATAVTFGLGSSVADVWAVLNEQLKQGKYPGMARKHPHGRMMTTPLQEKGSALIWLVVYTIDVIAADAPAAAAVAYQYMKDPASLPPVLDVADGQGKITRVDLAETKDNPRKEKKSDE